MTYGLGLIAYLKDSDAASRVCSPVRSFKRLSGVLHCPTSASYSNKGVL